MAAPDLDAVAKHGLVLLGCGKMGSAMLQGWLDQGVPASSVWILDPHPSDWVRGIGAHLNTDLPTAPAICILAVKPQMMGAALPSLTELGNGSTVFLSVAAGTALNTLETVLGDQTPIIRAMPNTPAAIGRGITAIIGNAHVTGPTLDMAQALLEAVGQVVRLDDESQMDAVTGVSGSGPAYVFHMIEAMTQAGVDQGLSPGLALQLAKATVAGAGALAEQSEEPVDQLRVNVTSPNGTTAAGLEVLMNELPDLMNRTVTAATNRSQELGRE